MLSTSPWATWNGGGAFASGVIDMMGSDQLTIERNESAMCLFLCASDADRQAS